MSFNSEQITKLKRIIQEGIQVKREIDDLSVGLKETVAAIAEEMNIKPSVLNKVIVKAFKGDFDQYQSDFESMMEILEITGNKL